MSEETKSIIVEQSNIEASEILEIKEKSMQKCHKYMSAGHTYCYCGRMFPSASEDVQEHILKNNIWNFEIFTTSAFEIKKEPPHGNKYGISKEAQNHGNTKDAWKRAKQKGYSTILERHKDDTYRERMTELGLNENDNCRRDQEPKIDRINIFSIETLWIRCSWNWEKCTTLTSKKQ